MSNPIQSVLHAIRAKSQRVQEIDTELSNIAAQKHALLSAPISLEDFKSLLPKHIRDLGEAASNNAVTAARLLTDFAGSQRPSKAAWSDLTVTHGRPTFLAGLSQSGGMELLAMVIPEQVERAICAMLDRLFPNGWGNDMHPSIAQREVSITQLDAFAAKLREERDKLKAELDEVNRARGAAE